MIIFHDYGSADNAGMFTKSFMYHLGKNETNIYKVLHKNYPYENAKILRLFGYFDNFRFKNILKFVEILFISIIIVSMSAYNALTTGKKAVVIINIYQPFKHYYWLLKLNIFANSMPILHDVVTHKNKLPDFIQLPIEKFACDFDCILLSEHSRQMFDAFNSTMDCHVLPFPLFYLGDRPDLDEQKKMGEPSCPDGKKIRVGCIGNLRYEKGVETILDALHWKEFKNIEVTVAGHNFIDLKIIESEYPSVSFRLDFLDPIEYDEIFSSLDYCFLIYDKGVSNSGIIYDALARNVIPIVSDIPLFRESPFSAGFLFAGNISDLRNTLEAIDAEEYRADIAPLHDVKSSYVEHTKSIYFNFIESIK